MKLTTRRLCESALAQKELRDMFMGLENCDDGGEFPHATRLLIYMGIDPDCHVDYLQVAAKHARDIMRALELGDYDEELNLPMANALRAHAELDILRDVFAGATDENGRSLKQVVEEDYPAAATLFMPRALASARTGVQAEQLISDMLFDQIQTSAAMAQAVLYELETQA